MYVSDSRLLKKGPSKRGPTIKLTSNRYVPCDDRCDKDKDLESANSNFQMARSSAKRIMNLNQVK